MQVVIWADGACSGNGTEHPIPGAAAIITAGKSRIIRQWGPEEIAKVAGSFGIAKMTNQVAELLAVALSLQEISPADRSTTDLVIHSDSEYTIGQLSGKFKTHAHAGMISAIKQSLSAFKTIKWHYKSDEDPEVDKLAKEAREKASLRVEGMVF